MSVVFVLIMTLYHGGINTDLTFSTLQQCETVAATARKKAAIEHAFCVEQQVKQKKLKCKIENRTDYQNSFNMSSYTHNLDGYPYPVGISCVEE
jgi:hypothetical protein